MLGLGKMLSFSKFTVNTVLLPLHCELVVQIARVLLKLMHK